jgi:UDP-3-O-acyl-N-acetylglucosamine deacetylase
MLVDQLKSKVDDLEYLHTSLGSVAIQNHNLNIYGKEIPFTKTSRKTFENFLGFSSKFSKFDEEFKDNIINKALQIGSTNLTFVIDGSDNVLNIVKGHKNPVPLENVFNVVENVIPDPELSLFRTNGFSTEFTVTSKEIAASINGNSQDVTRGGIYLKTTSSGKPTMKVIPVLHRYIPGDEV